MSATPQTKLLFSQAVNFSRKIKPNPSALVRNLAAEFSIREAVIEDQYLSKNPDSLKKLSWNVGRWQEACASAGVSYTMLAAKTWQTVILGSTRMKREQIKMVSAQVARAETGQSLSEDVSDAYCIGRYWVIQNLRRLLQ